MGKIPMTERQKIVLDFIAMYIKMKGYAPSYQEIATALNLRSKSNIHRIIHSLQKKGLIHVKPHMIRSLKLMDKSVDKMVSL
jgi:repressor LexA